MEHEIDGYQVHWVCDCGEPNDDWFNWTAFPVCFGCIEGYDWSEILTDGEIAQLSKDLNPHDRSLVNGLSDW